MATRPTYKTEVKQMTVSAAIDEAYSELQSLGEEMREWHSNLDGGNLGHTEKAQSVSDAADTLEGIERDESAEDNMPDELSDRVISVGIAVKQKQKNKPMSRAMRCSNAVSMMNAAADAIREYIEQEIEKLDEGDAQAEKNEDGLSEGALRLAEDLRKEYREKLDELDSLVTQLEDHASEADNVEFPGMFG